MRVHSLRPKGESHHISNCACNVNELSICLKYGRAFITFFFSFSVHRIVCTDIKVEPNGNRTRQTFWFLLFIVLVENFIKTYIRDRPSYIIIVRILGQSKISGKKHYDRTGQSHEMVYLRILELATKQKMRLWDYMIGIAAIIHFTHC